MASINPIVVIIEDEADVATFLARIVERRGFESRVASSGKQAFDIICHESDRICLVILDILLPKESGGDVAKQILQKYPHIRIVVSTAISDYTYYKELMALGVRTFLRKPYEISELDRVLKGEN